MEYISSTETAKLVRKSLKEAFPMVKFSVKTKPSGQSITVAWKDGPNDDQVKYITYKFRGSIFDKNECARVTKFYTLNSQPVSFCSDFITLRRSYTELPSDRSISFCYSGHSPTAASIVPLIRVQIFNYHLGE